MRLLRIIWFRLRALLQRDLVNAELDDELRFHVERETVENIKRGMNADEARRTALAQFGGVERFKEYARDERHVGWLDDISADVKHGARLLRQNALFSTTVILTLALGIGATSTIFAIVNGVLLRPLPFPNAERVVSLAETRNGVDNGGAGQYAFQTWASDAQSFSAQSAYSTTSAVLTGDGEPVEVTGASGGPEFLAALGVSVALGRGFAAEDFVTGAQRVIVLSHSWWLSAFGGDSAVLNRAIVLGGRPRRVIGIMPPAFDFPAGSKFWVPLVLPNQPGVEYYFSVVARLRPGLTVERALSELRALSPRVDARRTPQNGGLGVSVMTMHDRLFGSVQKPLAILLGAVVVLLLIACANVANLTLARSASRQREFAVRLALGAGKWRLVRQLLVESSLLAAIGGALGALVPVVLVNSFVKLSPASVAGVSDIRVDGTVVVFTALISVAAALIFGLAPALSGTRSGPSAALGASSNRASGSRAQRGVRSALVIFEVSAALIMLTGAGLLTTSFSRAMRVSPGFIPDNLFSASIYLPGARYPDDANVVAFYDRVAEQLRGTPGIDVVSVGGARPLGSFTFSKPVARMTEDSSKIDMAFSSVDAFYGRAAGLHLVAGRFINTSDVRGAPRAVMLTVGAANHLFPGENAVGRTLPLDVDAGDSERPATVVGVVEDVTQRSLDEKPMPQIFLAIAQRDVAPQHIVIRTSLAEATVRATVKSAVLRIDPLQPVNQFYVLSDEVARSVAPRRFNSILINAFAGLALLLSTIGLYGLMAHAVSTRTRELGIRMALGAQSSSVLRLVLKQGALLLLSGVAAGVLLSLLLSRFIASLLYDVPAQDPLIFIGAPVLLALVGLAACYLPARRATLVNPIAALRQD